MSITRNVTGLFNEDFPDKIGNKALRLRTLNKFKEKIRLALPPWKIPDGKILIYDVSDSVINFLREAFENELKNYFGNIGNNYMQLWEYIMDPHVDSNRRYILEKIYSSICDKFYNSDGLKKILNNVRKVINEANVDMLYLRSSTNIGDKPGAPYAGIFKSIPIHKKISEKNLIKVLVEFYGAFVSPKAIYTYWKHNDRNLKNIKVALFIHGITSANERLSGQMEVFEPRDEITVDVNYGLYIQRNQEIPICEDKTRFTSTYHTEMPFKVFQDEIQRGEGRSEGQPYWADINLAQRYGFCAYRDNQLKEKIGRYKPLVRSQLIPIISYLAQEIDNNKLFPEFKEKEILIEFTCPDDSIEIVQIRSN